MDDYNQQGRITPFTQDEGGMCWIDPKTGEKGNEVYYIGIIDILQKYNKRKKVEHFFKTIQHESKTVSAVPPKDYADRMLDFLFDKFE